MKKPPFRLAVVVALLLGIGLGAPARADISPDVLGAGPSFAPPGDNPAAKDIGMANEKVVLELHTVNGGGDGSFIVVDATFTMKAPKKPVTLQVAFPGDGVRVGDAYVNHPRLVGFKAFVDGKPVASKADEKEFSVQAGPPSSPYKKTRRETWHTFPAVIDDETVVRVRYAVAAEPMGFDEKQTHAKAQYILHTGAAWAGKIGEAVIEVRGVDVDVEKTSLRTLSMSPVSLVSLKGDAPPPPVSPPNTTRTKTTITTTFKDFEPGDKDDVEVVFPAVRDGYPDDYAKSRAALEAAMEKAAK